MSEFLETLQEKLNFTNSEGEVITFFDGKLTIAQLILIVVAILAVAIVLKFLKGIVRTCLIVGIAVGGLIYFGVLSPTQVRDIGEQIKAKGMEYYEEAVKMSENIKFEDSTIKIKIGEEWYDITDVKSYVNTKDGLSIKVGDETVAVDDKGIVDMIKSFK